VHLKRIFPIVLFAFVAACGGGARPAPVGSPGGPAPAAAVERFLRLAAEKNYQQMGYVFGTRQGPVMTRDPRREVEQRMAIIAEILVNDRFVIRREEPIPGRMGEAVTLTVDVTRGGATSQVPFTVVRSGGYWLVENVMLERVTRNPK